MFHFQNPKQSGKKKEEEEKNPIHFINSVASFAEYHKFPKRPIASETEWRAIVNDKKRHSFFPERNKKKEEKKEWGLFLGFHISLFHFFSLYRAHLFGLTVFPFFKP